MKAESLKRYPAHLSDRTRLEVVKAYLLHELPSLRETIENLAENCERRSSCEEIYDLFYAVSLVYKRKFIAKEVTSEGCKWVKGKVKLGQLKLSTYIDGLHKFKWELIKM